MDMIAGMPYPVFYAVVFHPAAAVLALAVGADGAIRLCFLLVIAIQTWQVRKLCVSVGSGEKMAWLTAALMGWATYSMTNLATRGAMAEFVGASLLVSAMASLMRGGLPGTAESRPRLLFQGCFFYALAAGTHPITGLLGALFLVTVPGPLVICAWRKMFAPIAAGAVIVVCVLV